MSGGSQSSRAAQVWAQLAHVSVMTVRLFTTSLLPSWWHLGQGIGSGWLVFGMTAPSKGLMKLLANAKSAGSRSLLREGDHS
jgi:hypothetical protein